MLMDVNPYQTPASADSPRLPPSPWYTGITRYQWLVLAIASLGWIFDVFEGQILLSSEKQMLAALLPAGTSEGMRDYYKYVALGAFLAGGALGGVIFGAIADRIGRARTMVITILMYSLFTCLTAFVQSWWQVVALRLLVALGVGGEWAVASAMVAEVFPPKARAWSGAIFHGSSVLGTYLAVAAGNYIVAGDPQWGWRIAFMIGALPALLTLWIRWQLREPETWSKAAAEKTMSVGQQLSSLFAPGIASRTLLGFALAVIGLATFWGVHIHGKELTLRRERTAIAQETGELSPASESQSFDRRLKRAEMWGMFLTTTGGGMGLLCFGPICEWLGRRRAFALFHLGGLVMGILMFQTYRHWSDAVMGLLLVLFGFWTLGMHAGYAIYFPELFPTRLRSLGAGFCFNFARITTAVMLIVKAYLARLDVPLETAGTILSLLFVLGVGLIWFGPETKGTELAS
jgi:MFS family permease